VSIISINEKGKGSGIENVRLRKGGEIAEIIVVDGHAEAETVTAIWDSAVRKLHSEKGRGKQLNRGAAIATGDDLPRVSCHRRF
jgi:hypothetical protein